MHAARDVARYFLTLSEPDEGDFITNLKLQKLCYYAQGFSLVLLGGPIFREDLVVWAHGPVVESLYHEYKEHGHQGIPVPLDFDVTVFTASEKGLLDDVWNAYGQFSAWKLRNMTHVEPPWVNTKMNDVISHEALIDYFEVMVE
jgi:uncharacterized phage-associated protein